MFDPNITINFNGSPDEFFTGLISMTNQLEPKRFWAIWAIFFILACGVAIALILWAYSLVQFR